MISVITPTRNTPPEILSRTFASLKAQTHTDWEWIVWDDSTTDAVWQQLWGLCADERYVIRPYRSMMPSGSIGQVKRNGFMVATGDILVELDHDDELLPDALESIESAFDANPEVGFVYSDWCEILPDGSSGRYPEGWAFGYGSEYWSGEHGCWVMSAPPVNRVTMSHIVSAPNHVRAWRAAVYRRLGGHDPSLRVADDYDLCVRTVLEVEVAHIPRLLYRQHIGPSTAQRVHNDEVQARVAEISGRYGADMDRHFGTLAG